MSVTPTSSRAAPSEVTLIPATLDGAAQLARTAAALFEQTFGDANTPEDMRAYLADAFSEARQRAELADERNRIWLARAPNGSIVGYAHVRLEAPAPHHAASVRGAEIARLYADRAWHGRGLGAWLMHTCIAVARENQAEVLWLGVWERNARAITFYEKQGFHIIGEQSFMLGADRQRDLVMALDLTTE